MHIAFLNWDSPVLPYRGVGQVNHYLLKGLLRAGHQVSFVVVGLYHGPKVCEEADRREIALLGDLGRHLQVRYFNYTPPRWLRWRPGQLLRGYRLATLLRRLHREVGFDLLELPDGMCEMPFHVSKRFPQVVRIHGSTRLFDENEGKAGDPFTYWREKRTLEAADFLVGVSRFSLEATLRVHGVTPRHPGTCIYNALDTAKYTPGDDPEAAAEEGHILFINGIDRKKGAVELCQAMKLILAKFPGARLTLIGGMSGKKLFTPEDRAKLLSGIPAAVQERITTLGWVFDQEEKIRWLRRAAVCCFPSKIETFGMAPLEAMAMQRPVVYTRGGAGPELIEDGVSGLLANPHDPGDIAEKILYLLQNPVEASQIAAAGRQRAVEKFAMGPWIEENIAFYERCLRAFR